MLDFLAQNWWYLLIVAGFAFMMFRGGGCCGGGDGRSHSGHDNSGGGCCGGGGHGGGGHNHYGNDLDNGQYGSDQTNNRIEMVRDPVCGMTVDPAAAIKQDVDGKTYYFCSEACRRDFAKLANR